MTTGSDCCLGLGLLLGPVISFPNTPTYINTTDSYFSQQQIAAHPACVVPVITTEDVSKTLAYLTDQDCPYAVRSGGHQWFSGSSSTDGGVTIDLRGLNNVQVGNQNNISIGAGATWSSVYAQLDPLNISVAGARAASVGVGGYLTGGGISHFAPRYGFGCDTILEVEMVIADGTVVYANSINQHTDLSRAVRGGSNNFGIVTKVTLQAFEQGPFLGGNMFVPLNNSETVIAETLRISDAMRYDPFASLITSFIYNWSTGPVISLGLEYTKSPPEANPEVFCTLRALKTDLPQFPPAASNTMRIGTMGEFAAETDSYQPKGMRAVYTTITTYATYAAINATYARYLEYLPVWQAIPNVTFSLNLEPLPPNIYLRGVDTNALGFKAENVRGVSSLLIVQISVTWLDARYDKAVQEGARNMMTQIENDAEKIGDLFPFQYLNYAAPWQSPIASYGEKSVLNLRTVSTKYDRKGALQTRVGGHKIPQQCIA